MAKFKQKWFIHKIIHIIHNEFLDIMQLPKKSATNKCFVKYYHNNEKAPNLGAFWIVWNCQRIVEKCYAGY